MENCTKFCRNKCYFVSNEITKVDYGVFADEKDGQEVYNTEYK